MAHTHSRVRTEKPEFTACGKGSGATEQLLSALVFGLTTEEGAIF